MAKIKVKLYKKQEASLLFDESNTGLFFFPSQKTCLVLLGQNDLVFHSAFLVFDDLMFLCILE